MDLTSSTGRWTFFFLGLIPEFSDFLYFFTVLPDSGRILLLPSDVLFTLRAADYAAREGAVTGVRLVHILNV